LTKNIYGDWIPLIIFEHSYYKFYNKGILMLNKIPLLLLLFSSILFAQNDSLQNGYTTIRFITEWLNAGPMPIKNPVTTGEEKKFEIKDLLEFEPYDLNMIQPSYGDKFEWNGKTEYKWEKISAKIDEVFLNQNEEGLSQQYLAAYIKTNRWMKAKLEISSCEIFKVYLNGEEIISKTTGQTAKNDTTECSAEKKSKEVELETGKHLLVVKTIKQADKNDDWKLKVSVILDSNFYQHDLHLTLSPGTFAGVDNLLEDPKLGAISISANGNLIAAAYSKNNPDASKESWLNIFNSSDGTLRQSFKGSMNIPSVKWAPAGNKFAYPETSGEQTTLWLYNVDDGSSKKLLEKVKNFSSYEWSPDESFIIYSINEKAPENKSGFIKIDEPKDRMPGSKNRSYLYKINLSTLVKKRLTAGSNSTILNSISSDSKKIIFSTSEYDLETRPYVSSTYYMLDLSTNKMDSIFTGYWSGGVQFSPDGKKILVLGGPSLFGKIGISVLEDMIPNDFDKQAYIYDLQTKEIDPITLNFDPSIESAFWSGHDNHIYFLVSEKTFQFIYKYDVKNKGFEKIDAGIEVITTASYANNFSAAVVKGSGATIPEMLYYIDLKNGTAKMIDDPGKESFKNITVGKTKIWNFKNKRGEEIEGLVYFPPDFDNTEKYPLIVFYYGGTNPTEQAFEGRYPRNIWAANGYVVYVLQPSGATGFGQQFSAYHVNDWGEITADEIIEGTKLFLKAHTFIDPKRVGCIGASYGGFMTMNVLTKTDIFATGISHAGISSLAGYWGIGYWGYLYSGIAAANSFPWNRRDIYVDQSPLYNADKINTPLLLLHGSSDTNVPVGESIQMFTALKLLGKPVELIQVEGQDHHILDYKKRKQWTKTIIAWFDKYLKDQPQWYDNMYKTD
jgi:dipeptidyl aminopeptidase/acylaminoacyl peptidase